MVSNEFMLELVSKTDIYEELRLRHITLDNDEHRDAVKRTLMMQNNDEIDLDTLKAYLEAEKEYNDTEETFRYQALKLKYEALTTIPSTIEKTMTPAQLFKSESPLWAYGQTIYRIQQVQELYNRIKHNKQKKYEFYKLFDDLLNNETCYLTTCHIEEL